MGSPNHFVENPIPITIDDLSGGFPYDSGNLETGAQEHHFNGPNGPSTVIMSPWGPGGPEAPLRTASEPRRTNSRPRLRQPGGKAKDVLNVLNDEDLSNVSMFVTSTVYIYIYMGFHKWVYPKMVGLQWKIPLNWMIWGYPYFRKPSYMYIYVYIYI